MRKSAKRRIRKNGCVRLFKRKIRMVTMQLPKRAPYFFSRKKTVPKKKQKKKRRKKKIGIKYEDGGTITISAALATTHKILATIKISGDFLLRILLAHTTECACCTVLLPLSYSSRTSTRLSVTTGTSEISTCRSRSWIGLACRSCPRNSQDIYTN